MTNFFDPTSIQGDRAIYQMSEKTLWLQEILIAAFAFAIADFEGFFKAGSIAQKNNNPGNLRPLGASQGFRTFDTPKAGWSALVGQIITNVRRGLTLREFFLGKPGVYPGYAPLGDNEPQIMEEYINHVAQITQMGKNVDLRLYFPNVAERSANRALEGLYYFYPLAGRVI